VEVEDLAEVQEAALVDNDFLGIDCVADSRIVDGRAQTALGNDEGLRGEDWVLFVFCVFYLGCHNRVSNYC